MITDAEFAAGMEIFFGDASDAMCRVYARWPEADAQGCTLSGSLTGPMCPYAHTLPVTLSFVDRGPGEAPLAEAYVPEPCFWTPEMPHVYRALVQLSRDGRVLAKAERLVGIRTLGAIGRNLIYDAKRWVLRGVRAAAVPPTDLEQWRESGAAMIVSNPGDALCEQASRIGVLLVAEIDEFKVEPSRKLSGRRGQSHFAPKAPQNWDSPRQFSDRLLGEIRRLSRWPAVGLVTLPAQSPVELDGLRHNLLLAERFDAGQSITPSSWARAAVREVLDVADFAAKASSCPIALIAFRPDDGLASVAEGRSRCDHLQRDMACCVDVAGRVDLAGYIV